ncbi:MAG: hypothetical protein ACQEV0_03900 [Bacillota bacterium]
MRKLQVIAMFLLITFILSECQNGLLNAEQQSAKKIVLHQMKSFGQVKENSQLEVTDEQTIGLFAEAISSADKVSGVADEVDPDFKVGFGEKEFYIWVAEGHGSVLEVAGDYTLYNLEGEHAEQLYSFFSSENLLE